MKTRVCLKYLVRGYNNKKDHLQFIRVYHEILKFAYKVEKQKNGKGNKTHNFAACEVKVMQNGKWLFITAGKIEKMLLEYILLIRTKIF